MRIILYTGKGGVGKTSAAAATALRCAEMGYRTIVMSTDAAHSLADSFDQQLAPYPKKVAPNLWGQEVDIFHEIRDHWGTIQEYLVALMAWRGLDEIVAEELTVLPGMEELSSLLLITHYHDSGDYDVIVVDCAPTGETLRLLSFPEVARWWLEKVFPVQRKAYKLLRPMVKPFSDFPLPGEDVFDSVEDLFVKLDQMHALLSDKDKSSLRLVLNPEKMVIKEAQRTYTYLNLYGYSTDAIVCNRLIPQEAQDGYFAQWKAIQSKHYHLIEECFSPLPILKIPFFDQEVLGMQMLKLMADAMFGGDDPTKIMFQGEAHSIEKNGDDFVLRVPLPFVNKGDVELTRSGDELIARIGNQKRNLILPRAVVGLETKQAKLEDHVLRVVFGNNGNS
ncbi:MAG: ArsA family ATPase [Chloroflexi bacterium]|nr:ArsA family ATPase [Chloroflexota bacterium]MDA8187026.1 ArsA family ATPase [Dehalococcoidales bacterium]